MDKGVKKHVTVTALVTGARIVPSAAIPQGISRVVGDAICPCRRAKRRSRLSFGTLC
jgi:hypothetical protein